MAGRDTSAGGRTADSLPSGACLTVAALDATWDAVAGAIVDGG